MTKNQLEYLGLVETKRNNMVVSDENERHNRATESEMNRSNVARETETNRHNLVIEDQGQTAQQETQRHNLETEKAAMGNLNYQYAELAEHTRHNKVSEGNQMKVAKIGAEGQKTSAAISAEAHRASAAMSAEASKYGADTQAKTAAAERKWRTIDNQKNRALEKWKTAKTTKSQKDINKAKIASDKYLKNLELNRDLFKFNAEQKYKYDKLLKDYEVAKEKNDVDSMGNILRTISSLAGSYLNFAGNIARGN